MSNKTLYIGGAIIAVALIVFGTWWYQATPGKYDTFAQCLGEQEAKFYGAFWCPHCQEQKALFGKSEKLLPYIECSTPNGQGQLQQCIDQGIQGYPTWEFSDGERISGVVSLEALSGKTGCELP
jgi:hypothetical protein